MEKISSETSDTKGVTCYNCRKAFARWRDLKQHIRATHGSLICDYCLKVCSDINQLEHHLNTIHKKFLCTFCLRIFTTNDGVKQHKKALHEDIALTCKHCNSTFAIKLALNLHLEICLKKFDCTKCTLHFNSQLALTLHDLIKHTMFTCIYCDTHYETLPQLQIHLKDAHEQEKAYCHYCGELFIEVNKHIENKHLTCDTLQNDQQGVERNEEVINLQAVELQKQLEFTNKVLKKITISK